MPPKKGGYAPLEQEDASEPLLAESEPEPESEQEPKYGLEKIKAYERPCDRSGHAGLWSTISFSWTMPLVNLGVKRTIDEEDIPGLPREMQAAHIAEEVRVLLEKLDCKGKPPILRIVWSLMWRHMLKASPACAC